MMQRKEKHHEYNTDFRSARSEQPCRKWFELAWLDLRFRMPPTALLPPICLMPSCQRALEHPSLALALA